MLCVPMDLDTDEDVSCPFAASLASSGQQDETDVTITVKEKSWRSLHVGATTDGTDEAGVRSEHCRRRVNKQVWTVY